MNRRTWNAMAWALTAMWVGTLPVGCGGGSDTRATGGNGAAAPSAVALQLNWLPEPQFGGFYAADELGLFAQHGLNVDVRDGGPGAKALEGVALKQIAYGIAAGDQVVQARARGLDVVAVFAAFQSSPRAIMARAERGFTSLDDLMTSDVTIAIEPGRIFRDFLASKYDLSGLDVVPYQGAMARFVEETDFAMQCFATSEPIEAKKRGVEPDVFLVAEAGYNPYMTVLVVHGDRLREKPDEVKAMVEAVREGWARYNADPAAVNALIVSKNGEIDAETCRLMAEAQAPLVAPTDGATLGTMTLERWSTLVQQLVELKAVDADEAPDPASCFSAESSSGADAPAAPTTTAPAGA